LTGRDINRGTEHTVRPLPSDLGRLKGGWYASALASIDQ
jgi:hypothetical protein